MIFSAISNKVRRFLTGQRTRPPRRRIPGTDKKKVRLVKYSETLHLLLFPVLLLYCEILLRLFTGTGIFQHLIYPVLFGLSLGLLLNIPTTFFPRKINRRITIVLMAVIEIAFIAECLIYNSYGVYMTIGSILQGAGGVMTGFAANLIGAIVGGLLPILLLLLPLAAYILMGDVKVKAFQYRPVFSALMLLLGLVFFGLGSLLASTGETAEDYSSSYEFSNATITFGLPTGLRLSMIRSDEGDVDFIEDEPVDLENLGTEILAEASEALPSTESVESPTPVVTGWNVMDLDFDKVLSENSDSETVEKLVSYVQSQEPANKNAYTGLFEGKNLILITAEAFSNKVISEELTPTLYRMQQQGFYFSDYYQPAWGGSTITGEYSYLIGLSPHKGVETLMETKDTNLYFTMGNQLQRLGYYNIAYHNGDYNYYDRQLTHPNLGYGTWLGTGNGLEDITDGRYPSDSSMFSKTLDTYIDKQPFSIYYMTVSGHASYNEKKTPVKKHLETVKSLVGDKYEETTLYYLCCQYELELAMEVTIEKLEAAGIADDTVIVITGDHYPYGLAKSSAWGNSKSYIPDLYQEDSIDGPWDRDQNALLIWSGCLENENKDMACEISTPTYSLDVLPTLSNLFGLEYDSRMLVGRDVFSDADPLVYWNDGTWVTDKGIYYAKEKTFTPKDGVTVDDDYVSNIKKIVTNKQYFSKKVRGVDFYGLFFGKDTDTSSND